MIKSNIRFHKEETDIGFLVIRSDANTQIGTGHVMRCLALAQAWSNAGGSVVFGSANLPLIMRKRLLAEGFLVRAIDSDPGTKEDAEETIRIYKKVGASWLVVDGYHFGSTYQRILRESGNRFLFIDDSGHSKKYCADVVLNQNICANKLLYNDRKPETRLLLGTDYVLLRREFLKWYEWKRNIPKVARRLLITFGGSDNQNMTQIALRALIGIPIEDLRIKILIGSQYPYKNELNRIIRDSSISIRMEQNTQDVPSIMAWADFAIGAAGSTTWELLFMGLPSILISIAENQKPVVMELVERQLIAEAPQEIKSIEGNIAEKALEFALNQNDRQEMSKRGRRLIDGFGASRVVQQMTTILGGYGD